MEGQARAERKGAAHRPAGGDPPAEGVGSDWRRRRRRLPREEGRAYHGAPLFQMSPGVDLAGTVMARGAVKPSEVQQRLREAFEGAPPFPDPQQPAMLPEPEAILVDSSQFRLSRAPLPEDAAGRESNRLAAEVKKKQAELRRKKRIRREEQKRDLAKCRRLGMVSSSEEEEELNKLGDTSESGIDDNDDNDDGVDWSALTPGDEDVGGGQSTSAAAGASAPPRRRQSRLCPREAPLEAAS
ncbi:hypothetical protein PVAP13_5NG120600 [Panicum virgatum]|uniref:Uncharacterized protein n=1 Tax=Panicum virgatum TaxID=38727 RepID=A0A8T0RNF1_PANVG|nr:hypothetical protein PVAP13_5NG120600 [Panicum virgatum]